MSAPQILDIYDKLTQASDDRSRARQCRGLRQLERRYPHLSEQATRGRISETELRLRKVVEQVRLDLTREIEKVRGGIKEAELRHTKEIVGVWADLLKWGFVFWASQLAAILILMWRIWPAR